jgi:hypothetical protein
MIQSYLLEEVLEEVATNQHAPSIREEGSLKNIPLLERSLTQVRVSAVAKNIQNRCYVTD